MHTRTHTCEYTRTRTHTHTCARTRALAQARAHAHTRTYTDIKVYPHVCIFSWERNDAIRRFFPLLRRLDCGGKDDAPIESQGTVLRVPDRNAASGRVLPRCDQGTCCFDFGAHSVGQAEEYSEQTELSDREGAASSAPHA